jgi:hypothetical protein
MSDLFKGNLNSDYFKAYYLGKKRVVFVENEDDVPFWYQVLKKGAPNEHFVIMPSVSGTSTRGKTSLTKLLGGQGAYMLLCMDSDYDYLLQNMTICNQPFVFQTYTYSFENYKCYAPSLAQLCVQATLNDTQLFDFELFLKCYSNIIFDLFLISVYSEQRADSIFTRSQFSEIILIKQPFNIQKNGEIALMELQKKVDKKLKELLKQYIDIDLNTLKQNLKKLDVHIDNAYLFMNGHTLLEKVVFILLHLITNELRNLKYQQFNQEKIDAADFKRKKNEYNNKIQVFKTVLALNTNYEDCFLFQKIILDIRTSFSIS